MKSGAPTTVNLIGNFIYSNELDVETFAALYGAGGISLLRTGDAQTALAKMGEFSWTWKFFKAQLTNWWLPGCGITFIVATVLWFHILKNYPFGIAYPLSCMSYLFGLFAALLVFKEPVTASQWAGVLLVMAGCALIVK